MSNDVIAFDTSALPSLDDLQQGVASAAAQMAVQGGDTILRFNRQGEWLYGVDSTEVEEGSQWAINPTGIRHGWIRWGDARVLGEQTVPINQPRPAKPAVPDDGEVNEHGKIRDWDELYSFPLVCLTGEDEGTEVVYSTTSHGGKQAVKDYLTRLHGQVARGGDEIVAVVQLENSSYKHKKYDKIYTPEFKFLRWLSIADMNEGPVEQEKPKASRKRAPKEEVVAAAEDEEEELIEETTEEPAPTQRRRRRRQAS